MNTLAMFFSVVFGVVLLGALAAGGYWGVKLVTDLFAMLAPQTAALIAIASVLTLLCSALRYRAFALMSEKEERAPLRVEQANLYERVLLLWGVKLKNKTAPADPAAENELQQLVQLLTLRGSPRVIKAYVELHTLEKAVGLHSPDLPSRLASVQLEMRKDLGLSVENLKAEDLLQLLFDHETAAPDPGVTRQPQDLQPRVSLAVNA